MKKIFTYCLMLSAFAANAKENKGKKPSEAMKHPVVQKVMEKQLTRSSHAAKTTAVNKRLLANTYRNLAPAALLDSTKAWYSGNRHSGKLAYRNHDVYTLFPAENVFEAGFMMYDSARNFSAFNGPFALNQERFIKYTQDSLISFFKEQYYNQPNAYNYYYDIVRNSAGVVDSYAYYQGDAPQSPNYSLLQTVRNYYDAQGNISVDSIYYNGVVTSYGLHTYNTNNDPLTTLYIEFNGSTWDSSYRTTYTYSGTLPTMISSDVYDGGWQTSFVNHMAYDANDRMVSSIYEADFMGTGTIEPFFKDSFGYTGNFDSYILHESYFMDAGQWAMMDKQTFTLNAAGNQDTIWYYDLSSGIAEIAEKDPVIYDNDGYITRINGYLYDAATQTYAATPYDENKYYYEIINDVPNVPGNQDTWTVYPNPASQYITIRNTSKQPFVVTLYNMAGQQVVKQKYQPYDAVQLHMNTLPAGVYMLQLSNLEGARLHSQQVIKQ